MIYISNCCGAEMKDYLESEICPTCGEHCEVEEVEEQLFIRASIQAQERKIMALCYVADSYDILIATSGMNTLCAEHDRQTSIIVSLLQITIY